MTVILVLLTFAIFVGIDALLGHRKVQAARRLAPTPALPKLEPVWVAGYQLPDGLYYHRGHTWARTLDADTVLVGIDDFARRLVGGGETLETPAVGDWLRQGETAFTIRAGSRAASFVSPLEGEVLEVNADLRQKPSLVLDDPFARGWVMKIRACRLGEGLRSLLNGSLARRWTEDARAALDLRLMALSGSVLQDGGEPVHDFARHLADEDWRCLVAEFLLT